MNRAVSASTLSSMIGNFDRSPAYVGLAEQLRELIGDGRLELGVRLPSERALTQSLGVSRTTVTRAYEHLRDSGFASSKQGSGTFTAVPGGRSRAHDRALMPRPDHPEDLDLNCAAGTAPPGLSKAYAEALAELPAYFGGTGYFPGSVPELAETIAARYAARGLPTTAEQIVVTPGALTATAVAARALLDRRSRAAVETPIYPNAVDACRATGARIFAMPLGPGGWDRQTMRTTIAEVLPQTIYTVPDFHNPTGHVMSQELREDLGAWADQAGSVLIIDEAHQELSLEPGTMPPPLASYSRRAITIGSTSKQFWGGLRIGWLRAPLELVAPLRRARQGLDLGAAVMEQLVAAKLLSDPEPYLFDQRARLRTQRDHLVGLLRAQLPEWEFVVPGGGMVLWCQLPLPRAAQLADAAEKRGVIISPGPVFSVGGGLNRFVRLPWTQPPEVLDLAVRRLAEAWREVVEDHRPHRSRAEPALVV